MATIRKEHNLKYFRLRTRDRDGKSLSQQQAADLAGVSRQTWAAWEQLSRPITLTQLEDIKKALSLGDRDVLELTRWGSVSRGAMPD